MLPFKVVFTFFIILLFIVVGSALFKAKMKIDTMKQNVSRHIFVGRTCEQHFFTILLGQKSLNDLILEEIMSFESHF